MPSVTDPHSPPLPCSAEPILDRLLRQDRRVLLPDG
jgi:hypothetical protein